ncbi:MAG: signal peptidase I [Ignavibacteriae bacterium HGW-Ignavibacteriae-3]|nr:MAG: signal peptidase I [Ignavibacteriae bacterium HGW-Ignavibacteriae-3]
MKRSEAPRIYKSLSDIFMKYFKEYGKMVLILFIVTSSFIQGSRVPTPSMETTIMTGDFLMTNKLAYGLTTPRNIPFTDISLPFTDLLRWGNPERGDIVVFEFPGNRDEIKNAKIDNYVKRCLALPGDLVEVRNKILYVNCTEAPIPLHIQYERNFTMPENFAEEGIFPKGSGWNGDNYGPIKVPGKGDIINLTVSNLEEWKTFINREFGRDVVEIKNGKIYIDGNETNKYKVHDDYYFMMGDNRDISLDCRYWGFVPRRNVVGTPMFVYWSWDSNIPFSDFINLASSVRIERIGKIVN